MKYILFKLYFFKYIGEKKYKCEYCNKIFFSFSSLKIYVCVYIGDRLFKCKECLRKFSDLLNFNKYKWWYVKQKGFMIVIVVVIVILFSIVENSLFFDGKVKEIVVVEQSGLGQSVEVVE